MEEALRFYERSRLRLQGRLPHLGMASPDAGGNEIALVEFSVPQDHLGRAPELAQRFAKAVP